MGRYWEQAKGWFFCKVWPFKTKSGRKRAAANVGPKPTNVKTFTKRTKAAKGYSAGYIGKSINSEYGGVKLSNPSYVKYYKGMI
jgi:hypothetical protein